MDIPDDHFGVFFAFWSRTVNPSSTIAAADLCNNIMCAIINHISFGFSQNIVRIADFLTDEDLVPFVPTCTSFCDLLDKSRYEVEDHWIFSSFQKRWTLSVVTEMEKRYSIVEKRPRSQKFKYGLKSAMMKRALLGNLRQEFATAGEDFGCVKLLTNADGLPTVPA